MSVLVGVCRPVLQIPTLFQTKKCHFSHPFSAPTSKKLWHHSLNKNASSHISFFLIHLETFIYHRLENHSWLQTKMGKILIHFTQHGAKSVPFWDGTCLYGSHKGEPPGSVNWPIQLVFPSFFRDILTNHNTHSISASVIGKYRSCGLGEGTPTIHNNFIIKVYFRDSRLSD